MGCKETVPHRMERCRCWKRGFPLVLHSLPTDLVICGRSLPTDLVICSRRSVLASNLWKFFTYVTTVTSYVTEWIVSVCGTWAMSSEPLIISLWGVPTSVCRSGLGMCVLWKYTSISHVKHRCTRDWSKWTRCILRRDVPPIYTWRGSLHVNVVQHISYTCVQPSVSHLDTLH